MCRICTTSDCKLYTADIGSGVKTNSRVPPSRPGRPRCGNVVKSLILAKRVQTVFSRDVVANLFKVGGGFRGSIGFASRLQAPFDMGKNLVMIHKLCSPRSAWASPRRPAARNFESFPPGARRRSSPAAWCRCLHALRFEQAAIPAQPPGRQAPAPARSVQQGNPFPHVAAPGRSSARPATGIWRRTHLRARFRHPRRPIWLCSVKYRANM